MFSFFKKKLQPRIVTYLTKVLKYKNVLEQFQNNDRADHVLLLYFFENTRDDMARLLEASKLEHRDITVNSFVSPGFNFLNARDLKSNLPKAHMTYVLEVHPLASINKIPLDIAGEALTYFTGLDEAVMKPFLNDRTALLLEKMGLMDNESIEHSMISKSILKAQEKLEKDLEHSKGC